MERFNTSFTVWLCVFCFCQVMTQLSVNRRVGFVSLVQQNTLMLLNPIMDSCSEHQPLTLYPLHPVSHHYLLTNRKQTFLFKIYFTQMMILIYTEMHFLHIESLRKKQFAFQCKSTSVCFYRTDCAC